MSDSLIRYDGREILGSRSRGSGVFAAYDWKDLIFGGTTGAIVRKAESKSNPRSFPSEDQGPLQQVLGHYSQVQSINCEDTVTWAVFQDRLYPWFPEFMKSLAPMRPLPDVWWAELWKRTPHPDTGIVDRGPEADVILHGDEWCFVVEAKWGADIKDGQGVQHQATQLDYRSHAARQQTGGREKSGVLVIVPSPARYPPAKDSESIFRRYFSVDGVSYQPTQAALNLDAVVVTWEAMADRLQTETKYHQECARYLNWRLSFLDQ